MIVCICNCVRSSEIKSGRERGIDSASDLFESLEIQPRCGSCVPEIQELLEANRYASASSSPAADWR